jgi:predicted house-cleaning noncanonical NTP pyrophosphatase (MazG superfamily)
MQYNKLVRNKIPEIIGKTGKTVKFKILNEAEYIEALERKLDEEIAEFHESKSLEELADVLEVLCALKIALGYDEEEVIDMRLAKYNERGGFEKKIFLIEVTENENS